MTKKTKEVEKKLQKFFFPKEGKTIEAVNLEEAISLLTK